MFKKLLIGLGVLVLVVVLGAAGAVYLIDWNQYRGVIQDQARKFTGRELQLNGDLKPSFFPWAGISIGDVVLANAEGFGETPFAVVQKADVRVELLPLLRREINVSSVQLHGAKLDLQRNGEGVSNWDDLLARETSTEQVDGNTTTEVEGNATTLAALAVGGIDIRDAELNWRDQQAGSDVQLNGFNLQTGEIRLDTAFPLKLSFNAASRSIGIDAAIEGKADVTLNVADQHYRLDSAEFKVDAKGAALPNGTLRTVASGDIKAAMNEQRIDATDLSLAIGKAKFDGQIAVTALDSVPRVEASISGKSLPLRQLMTDFGVGEMVTADAKVLANADLKLNLVAEGAAVEVNTLHLSFDDSTLNGSVAMLPAAAGALPPLRFDLALDQINVDRYLPPASETAENSGGTAAADAPIELPLEMLRGLDVDGDMSIGAITASGLSMTSLNTHVKANNGQITVAPVTASLYGGQMEVGAGLDARQATPNYQASSTLRDIDSEALLRDLLQGDAPISGQADVSFDVRSQGNSVKALKAASNGKFNADFSDGAINGVNIGYQVRRARSLLAGKSMKDAAPEQKTDFASMHISGAIVNGVIQSDDLDMRSPLLRLNGRGQASLPAENIDYTLALQLSGTAEGQGGEDMSDLVGMKLEVPVRASFEELAGNPAAVIFRGLKDNIAAAVKGLAEGRVRAEAEKLKAKAEAELKAQKAQAAEALKAQKAKAREQLRAQQDKAEQQLKDKVGDEPVKAVEDKLRGLLGR